MKGDMTRAMQFPAKLAIAFSAATMVFAFQNCGQFSVDASKSAQFASLGATGSAGAELVPSTDKSDPACATNSAYDACIYRQNPVVATGNAIYGVKLTSLSGSGRLENSTLSVRSIDGSQVVANPNALKVAPSTSGSSFFEQVNTYYWMNRAAEYFDARTSGALPAKGKGIKVVVDDTITGYETASKTIRLKRTDASGAVAWNGDIVVHMFGIANLMLANPSGWTSLSATKHATCNAVDKGCCTAAVGCANAVRFGVGEYFAISLFPDRTRIGEALTSSGNPQVLANVSRDVSLLSTNTSAQFFAASSGNAQAMGLLYASIWWQVRAAAGLKSAEIDRIFLEHLSLLDGSDDFASAIAKAKTVDARLFSGRHSPTFDAQLASRGL